MIGLVAKIKMSFMDGSLHKPQDGDINERAWKRCNNMVIGWIVSSLERHIAKSIMYLKTASDIWMLLQEESHRELQQVISLLPHFFSLLNVEECYTNNHLHLCSKGSYFLVFSIIWFVDWDISISVLRPGLKFLIGLIFCFMSKKTQSILHTC